MHFELFSDIRTQIVEHSVVSVENRHYKSVKKAVFVQQLLGVATRHNSKCFIVC